MTDVHPNWGHEIRATVLPPREKARPLQLLLRYLQLSRTPKTAFVTPT